MLGWKDPMKLVQYDNICFSVSEQKETKRKRRIRIEIQTDRKKERKKERKTTQREWKQKQQ